MFLNKNYKIYKNQKNEKIFEADKQRNICLPAYSAWQTNERKGGANCEK